MKKEEKKLIKKMNEELKEICNLLESPNDKIKERFKECKLKDEDICPFLIGYISSSLKGITSKLQEIQ